MNLEDPLWRELNGGYKIKYDASIALKKLEKADSVDIVDAVFNELWDELHHQGDVGLASYLALPQLVRIAYQKELYNADFLGICCVIEQQRQLGRNPVLPAQFHNYYIDGLKKLNDFVIQNIRRKQDETTFRIALSALALCAGYAKLSKAIGELEADILDEFLEQF